MAMSPEEIDARLDMVAKSLRLRELKRQADERFEQELAAYRRCLWRGGRKLPNWSKMRRFLLIKE